MNLGEKYCIICDRENIESIQKLLFSWGYKWNGQSHLKTNKLLPIDYFIINEKIYISNYSKDNFGWVLKQKFVYSTDFEDDDNVNLYTDIVLLRKEKLKKLNNENNKISK